MSVYICRMTTAVLGLGGNLGRRDLFLKACIREVSAHIGAVCAMSNIYETAPWGMQGNSFLNMAITVETHLSLEGLMREIKRIEHLLGRKRTGNGYASRTIDIDVLFYGHEVVEGEFFVPHPAISSRRFVLMPLVDLDPSYIHPLKQKSVAELLAECTDNGDVILWDSPTVIWP